MKLTKSILALSMLTLMVTSTAGCISNPKASPSSPAPAVVSVPDAGAAPPGVIETSGEYGSSASASALASRERRIMAALRHAFPDARRVTFDAALQAPDEALLVALQRARVAVVDASSPATKLEPDLVHIVLARDRAEARASSKRGNHRIVSWTDESAIVPYREGGIHVATPVDVDGRPRAFEHIVVDSPLPDLPARLVAADLWPATAGLEIVRIHDDGSRDVRLLGYLNAYVDQPEDHLSPSSGVYSAASLSTPPELTPLFRKTARSARGKVTGPTLSLLFEEQDRRRHTMIDAIGTCGNGWVSGAAVAVSGRARLRAGVSGSAVFLEIDVTGVESTLPVSTWLALAGPYREALAAVTRAVAKRGAVSAADYAPLARVHERIRAAYGRSASLLELDVMLRHLAGAFERGSARGALEAFEIRCRLTADEKKLQTTLEALAPTTY